MILDDVEVRDKEGIFYCKKIGKRELRPAAWVKGERYDLLIIETSQWLYPSILRQGVDFCSHSYSVASSSMRAQEQPSSLLRWRPRPLRCAFERGLLGTF